MQLLVRFHNTKTFPIQVQHESQLYDFASAFGFEVSHFHPPHCNLRLISRIQGGKGGFGTLLKGQSRLASENTTKDFSACRDLQGRRLRTVNDEIHQNLWKEWSDKIQAGTATIDDMAAALVQTQSGIAGWHLKLPAWAEVNPKKEQKRVKGLLEVWKQTQDTAKAEQQKRRDFKEQVVSTYMHQADAATLNQVDLVKDALNHQQQQDPPNQVDTKKRHKQQAEPPAACLTISGSAALEETNGRWRLESDANFSTIGIFLKNPTVPLYYEIHLITGGLCQVGWASTQFRPDSETGDGVGDDANSWAFDGSRAIVLHNEATESYGKPWKAGDVIGCLYDGHSVSFSMNGVTLGEAFVCERTSMFPAISSNPGEVIELRIYDKEMDYRPDDAAAVGRFLDHEANLDLLFVSSEPQKPPAQPTVVETVTPVVVQPDPIQLDSITSIEELEALGMDRLKAGLLAAGLKCGGTLQQRAERLFSIKGLTPESYPKKLLAKKC